MSKRRKYKSESRDWRGRSYKNGGARIRDLRIADAIKTDAKEE